jgi:hypothetical protein
VNKALDYQDEDLRLAPGEANLGLGCGNPLRMADLKPGEVVLDLGSGAGLDAFSSQIGGGLGQRDRHGWNVGKGAEHVVFSAYIQAVKPLVE